MPTRRSMDLMPSCNAHLMTKHYCCRMVAHWLSSGGALAVDQVPAASISSSSYDLQLWLDNPYLS